jgi:predicted oxidoreductase
VSLLLRHPAGIVPIIGTTNPDHVSENCAADGVNLSREEWYSLLASAAETPSSRLLGIPQNKPVPNTPS